MTNACTITIVVTAYSPTTRIYGSTSLEFSPKMISDFPRSANQKPGPKMRAVPSQGRIGKTQCDSATDSWIRPSNGAEQAATAIKLLVWKRPALVRKKRIESTLPCRSNYMQFPSSGSRRMRLLANALPTHQCIGCLSVAMLPVRLLSGREFLGGMFPAIAEVIPSNRWTLASAFMCLRCSHRPVPLEPFLICCHRGQGYKGS